MSDARKEALKKIVEKLGLPATSSTTTAVILDEIGKLQSKAAELEKLNAVLAKQRSEERAALSAASAPYSRSNPHPKCGQVAPASISFGPDGAPPVYSKFDYLGNIVSVGDPTYPEDEDFGDEVIEVYDDITPSIYNPKLEKIVNKDRSLFTPDLPIVSGYEDIKVGDKFIGKFGESRVIFGHRRRKATKKPIQDRWLCASIGLSSLIAKKPVHHSDVWYYSMSYVKQNRVKGARS
jgi:hypothetical protein